MKQTGTYTLSPDAPNYWHTATSRRDSGFGNRARLQASYSYVDAEGKRRWHRRELESRFGAQRTNAIAGNH